MLLQVLTNSHALVLQLFLHPSVYVVGYFYLSLVTPIVSGFRDVEMATRRDNKIIM